MQNGIYYLNALGISSIIREIKRQYFDNHNQQIKVVFTGGLSHYMTRLFAEEVLVDNALSLYGLKIILDEMSMKH